MYRLGKMSIIKLLRATLSRLSVFLNIQRGENNLKKATQVTNIKITSQQFKRTVNTVFFSLRRPIFDFKILNESYYCKY